MARHIVCKQIPKEDHELVFKFLYEKLNTFGKFVDKLKYEKAVLLIAEYLYRHSLVADTEINLAALMVELNNV
jgi:hypothetical protein